VVSKDMNQIRELLIGEFVQETRTKLDLINSKLDEIQEEYKRDIDSVSQSLEAKVEQLHQSNSSNYEYLENLLNAKLKEQKGLNESDFQNIKDEAVRQKEFTIKSLNSLKSMIDIKLKILKDDFDANSVSKLSLSSIFMEYSMKLKGSDIESELESGLLNKSNNPTDT
jgi:hypothetical protein